MVRAAPARLVRGSTRFRAPTTVLDDIPAPA